MERAGGIGHRTRLPPRNAIAPAGLRSESPNLGKTLWDETKDLLANGSTAAECAVRVVCFDEESALLSALGLACVVDRSDRKPASCRELFACPGQQIVETNELFRAVVLELQARGLQPADPENGGQPPRFAIGVPTLCCGDLLTKALRRIAGEEILVIDNGSQRLASQLAGTKATVFEPDGNLGVAASWNYLIRLAFDRNPHLNWLLLLNDDIELHGGQLALIREELLYAECRGSWFMAGPFQWSVFALSRACVSKVGFFDENFYPAYFEDNDYHRRIGLADGSKYYAGGSARVPATKRSSVTISRRPEVNQFQKNRDYYMRKWGGPPGAEVFPSPWNR